MATHARELIKTNGFDKVIEVIQSRVEDITPAQIPLKSVDVIVSEPLGTFLLNERMLETYILVLLNPNKLEEIKQMKDVL